MQIKLDPISGFGFVPAGSLQTPWLSDENASGYQLLNSGGIDIPSGRLSAGAHGAALASLYSIPFAILNSVNNGNNKYNIGFFGADTYPNSLGLAITVDPNNNYTEFQGTVIGASAADIKFNPEGGDTYIGGSINVTYGGNITFPSGGYFYEYNGSPAVYTNSTGFFIDGGNGRLFAGFISSPQDFTVLNDNNTFEGTNSYSGDNYLNSTPAGSTYIGYTAGSGGSSSGARLDVNGFIHTQDGSSLGFNGSYGLVVTAGTSLDNGQITTNGSGELDATTLSAGAGVVYGATANHDTINDWQNGIKSIDVLNGRLIDLDGSTIVANWRNGTGNFTVDNNLTVNGSSIFDSSNIASINITGRQLVDSSGTVALSWSNTGLSSDTSNTQSWIEKTSNVYGPSFDLWSTDTGGRRYRLISTGSSDAGGAGLFEIYDATSGGTRLAINSSGQINISNLTASQITATDSSKNLVSLATATYPSLAELAYVKGVTSAIQTQLNANLVKAGSVSVTGTATTTFTVTIGATQANTTYKVNVTPTSLVAAAVFYVNNKTTTTFDVVYLAGLTGAVSFDWALFK